MRKIQTKKSQQEIIITVLLVLIALAAVALIANFVIKSVRSGTESGTGKVDCLKISLEITRAIEGETTVSVRRGGEEVALKEVKVFVDGAPKGSETSNWTILETKTISIGTTALVKGQKIEVAPILAGGNTCSFQDTKTVSEA